jgi:hypothetical protein
VIRKMKVQTLITRYKNLGYIPVGGDRDNEVAAIIKWIWETYGYWIDCFYVEYRINDGKHYQKFLGRHMSIVDGHKHSCQCDKSFKNPYDALYDSVRDLYRHLKFMGYIIIFRRHFTEDELQQIINLKQGAEWASRNIMETKRLIGK